VLEAVQTNERGRRALQYDFLLWLRSNVSILDISEHSEENEYYAFGNNTPINPSTL